jgi:UDP-GlcNAc:undecaprenyl-phosphate GlcNAc-1-phosphate transferase
MPIAFIVFSLVALIATLSVTEMVRVFAHRMSAVDVPGGRRVHRRPTARLGGLGIYWGFYVALALATYGSPLWSEGPYAAERGMVGMMVGSTLLLLVGVMDDIYGLKATLKLCFQIAAGVLLWSFGWRVETLGLPGIGAVALGAASLPVTLFWVLLVTNAVNLIDGLDGLACGVALVATLAICALLAPHGGPLLVAAAALAGALIGFLWFNLNPALIFMGDAGSLFVGFVLAAMTLRASQLTGLGAFPLIPALLLLVPLADTGFAVLRRTHAAARTASSPRQFVKETAARVFAPDGQHIHHRLVRAGLTTRRAVLWLWTAASGYALAGWMFANDPLLGAFLLVVLVSLTARGLSSLRARAERVHGAAAVPAPLALTQVALVPVEGGEVSETHRRAA